MSETENLVIEIKDRELKMIKRILSNYDLKLVHIKKIRSIYKIKTETNTVCLKKISHEFKKVENGNYLVRELEKNEFHNLARYIATKEGKLIVSYKNLAFYLMEWVDGEECNLNDINEAVKAAKLLAKFHLATQKIDLHKIKLKKSNSKNWVNSFTKSIHDMEEFKKIIEGKKIKNKFDFMYEDLIDTYYDRGLFSIKILNESSYFNIMKNFNFKKTVCHNSFYYQNIIKNKDMYYIIDLNSIIIDLPITDLGKMIRRLMSKNEYMWDFEKAKTIIEGYNSVNKLSKDDIEIMLALIVFPHKFWKLGNKRYVKHKNWSENKYINRLDKIVSNNKYENNFIQNYINYSVEYQ
ncbi:CotS family spore coat protein [Clostridium felsineum]|uniref:CotS family spore coat protein n=1 Tax=Clostridium felsineum TaxID=36839 RepID=UPI00098CD7BF|nr:CotS family spore coat protein [Clostridium felsineum]URZ16279.1 Spore coat protein I [Clostridium felsineum DSM 794]